MPTTTFFRLPEEKRNRLIAACWAEVSRVRLTDISISRIITAAHIPRGSFYQYFEDKEDLIRYLLGNLQDYFRALFRKLMIQAEGDLFTLPILAYDRFIAAQGSTDPMLAMLIDIMRLNKGIDLQGVISVHDGCGTLPDEIWEVVDTTRLRHQDRTYADQVFHMSCAVLAFAVAESLWNPARRDSMRATLELRMDLLRHGGEATAYKEEAI